MALQKQNVNISLAQGLDTKTDPKQVVPGKLLLLENGIFTSPSRIKKRNGYAALSKIIEGTSTSITQGAALSNFKNELVMFSSTEIFSYSDSTTRWTDKGKASSLSISSKPVMRNTFQQTTVDSAYHSSGLEVFTWEDARGGSRYSIIDSATGESIAPDLVLDANAIKPKPFTLGNYIVILYIDTSTNHLRMLPIPVVNPTVPFAKVDLALDVDIASPNYDAALSNTRIYLAYNNSSGGTGITLKSINAFLVISAPRTVTGENADGCIALAVDFTNTQIWVAYHNGTQIKYFIRDSSLTATAVLAPTVIQANSNVINNITLLANAGQGDTYYTQNAAATYNNFIITAHLTNTGTVSGVGVFLRSVGIAAKPFLYNGVIYLTVAFSSLLQPTYFTINTSDKSVVAKFSPGVGGGLLAKNIVPEATPMTSGSYLIASLIKDLFTTVSGAIYTQTGVNSTVINFASTGAFDTAELGENLLITGGSTYMYDGTSIVEYGFNIFPENVSSSTATGTGSIGAGTYQYSFTYEWMDAQGQTHISAPSTPITQVTTTASSTNTLIVPTLRITDKRPPLRAPVTIVGYRTEGEIPGTTFYRFTSVTTPTLNDTTVDTVTIIDTTSDAALIGNPILYTTGGVLENIAPPAANYVTTYKDRIILLPSENTNQWIPSKQVVPGVPVEFSDALAQNMDEAGGKLVSAARMDSVLILLKEDLLYYVTGTGPDATGAQNDFSDAQPIASDGGCIDKNSVILTTAGLMYKSKKGIYLLGRDFKTSYIGADVEAFNQYSILSANLIDNTQQVRFILSNGVALVFDYYVNQWSVFTNHNAVDSVIFQNQFTYLQPDGLVLQETPGLFSDNGHFIKLKATTSWLSFVGLQAFQRVYRIMLLGEYLSPHQLKISAAYDFNPSATQESLKVIRDVTGAYGSDVTYGESTPYGGAFPQYQYYSQPSRQKCETIQITIEDARIDSTFGESVAFSALAFQVGLKQGLDKLAATKSMG